MGTGNNSAPRGNFDLPNPLAKTQIPVNPQMVNVVQGSIRWLKTSGTPTLTDVEKRNAPRQPGLGVVGFGVGVSIAILAPHLIPSEGSEVEEYFRIPGVTIECWDVPADSTHYQLDYRAHIPPGDLSGARAIEVTTNPDPARAWTPVLAVGEHRTFDPDVNRLNLAPPDRAPHYGSALNLSAANSTATVHFEMTIG